MPAERASRFQQTLRSFLIQQPQLLDAKTREALCSARNAGPGSTASLRQRGWAALPLELAATRGSELLVLRPRAGYNATSMPPKDGPPLVPRTPEGLERAIMLLGNRTKSALRKKARTELEELVGAYPNPAQAAVWKQMLTRMRKAKS